MRTENNNLNKLQGFTLVELSIILVIIGLLAGGILVGRDLIKASEIRGIITQKERYVTAANTFLSKYGSLPGDMDPTKASQFDFFAFTNVVASSQGFGDEDKRISSATIHTKCSRECGAFWRHLSDASLIDGTYGADIIADATAMDGLPLAGTPAPMTPSEQGKNVDQSSYMPKSKLGQGYWGAAHMGLADELIGLNVNASANIFYITQTDANNGYYGKPSMTGLDAFTIDSKIDDGKPNRGKMLVSSWRFPGDPDAYWSADEISAQNACKYGGASEIDLEANYNIKEEFGGNNINCQPVLLW